MATVCEDVWVWTEEQIETPLEESENRLEQTCRREACKWWMLCLNTLFCWLTWIVIKVIRIVLVTIGKWVVRAVCEVVFGLINLVGTIISLVLSIPLIGGLLRTVLNWTSELLWRLIGLPDAALTLAGVQIPKKMHLRLIILGANRGEISIPLTTEAAVLPHIREAQRIYRTECNINLIYHGACVASLPAPDSALSVGCDVGGFFKDWLLPGTYYEFITSHCFFEGSFGRAIGYGADLVVIVVQRVVPAGGSFVGCSMGPTHNYVVVDPSSSGLASIAHELGHACFLQHITNPTNLMNPAIVPTAVRLSRWQRAIVRNSRHCVFI